MKSEKIFFVMPAYNEEANIRDVVNQWYPLIEELRENNVEAFLTIANDGSKDKTFETLMSLTQDRPFLIALDKQNSGHGATLLYLYDYAIQNNADYIFQTDSDGQTLPEEFMQMWESRDQYDLQVGHRNQRQDGFSRKMVTKVLKGVVKFTFGVAVTDANTPFRLMNVESIKPILNLIPKDFFLSNVAISAIAVKKNLKTRWIPITFRPRQGGVNSINLKRIFKIGRKAIGEFKAINRNLKDS